MSRILFCDLDGTLLRDDKSISEGNREAIGRATAAGNAFVIATGRPFESAWLVAESLGLIGEGCYIVSYNGAHVYDCLRGRALLDRRLSMETVRELFAMAEAAGLYVQTYQDGKIIARAMTRELEFYAANTNLIPMPRADVPECLAEPPTKAIVIDMDSHERLERFRAEHAAWARGRCGMVFSNPMYLEVIPEGASKEAGIGFLADYLGVAAIDTIAAGDERNDIGMVRAAGIGVAVANAIPALKEAADYVTECDNNGDAIAEIIDKFVV